MNKILVKQSVEVIEQIRSRITILRHEDIYASSFEYSCSRIERKSSADQIFKMDGDALLSMLFEQRLEGFGLLDALQYVIYTLHFAEIFLL